MQENFVTVDGNRIRYLESGQSKNTIVLIHGLGASAERWVSIIPDFADHYRVIVPDLIGFGYSDKPLVDYTLEFFSNFLAKFFIAVGIESSHVVGSSMGGEIAANFATAYPNAVQRLVLVSPAGVMHNSTPALDAYIMAAMYPNEQNARNAFEMMEGSGKKADADTVREFVRRMRLPNAKLAFMSALLGLKNYTSFPKKLKYILAPTLVVWGSDDPVIPIKYATAFISSVRDCRFYRMEGCGHTPYVQAPARFSSLILNFLSGTHHRQI